MSAIPSIPAPEDKSAFAVPNPPAPLRVLPGLSEERQRAESMLEV